MNRDVDQGQRPSDFAQKTPNMQFSVVGSAPDFESRDPGSSLAAALHGTFLLVPLGKVLQWDIATGLHWDEWAYIFLY